MADKYFPIGHSDDFVNNGDRIRRMHISEEAKEVIVAKFLRFAHPFNYFLTPAKKRHICRQPVYKKDIGEDPRMISYVRQYLEKEYPVEYHEFISKIMWYEDPSGIVATGKERIDIEYGLTVSASAGGGSKKSSTPARAPKITIDLTKISVPDLEPYKCGVIAFQVLGAILNSGKVSKSDIAQFKSATETKKLFGLGKPLLSPVIIKDSKGRSKCYVKPFVLYGETLYMYSQWYDIHQKNLIHWIVNWVAANGGKI